MPRRFTNISGFVLAGGESRRMGRAKADLVLGGETMLARQIRLLRNVCSSVAIVGLGKKTPGIEVPLWPDELPGRGPAGGIFTALLHARTESSFIVGCDLPFLNPRFVRFLIHRVWGDAADAIVPESHDGRIQPVCAIYRRHSLDVVRASLAAELNKTQDLVHRLRARVVPWREISRAGFPPRVLANMNTPEDYEMAKRIVNSEWGIMNGEL
ncbi:MAG: molybdenum cofactor guanylyltransferase [Terriglobia bacterium]